MGCQSIAGIPLGIKFAGTHLYTWVERGTVRVKCLAQEHNTMSPARARTRTARSGDEHTNHEATAPPTICSWDEQLNNSAKGYSQFEKTSNSFLKPAANVCMMRWYCTDFVLTVHNTTLTLKHLTSYLMIRWYRLLTDRSRTLMRLTKVFPVRPKSHLCTEWHFPRLALTVFAHAYYTRNL